MKVVRSKENRTYKMCRELLLKKNRTKTGMYLVEGENLVREAAQLGRVKTIVAREGYSGEALLTDVETILMADKLVDEIVQTETDQGILAIVHKEEPDRESFFQRADEGSGNILVMDAVQDPGNIGTMIRTAVGAGYQGIIATKGTGDIYSSKVVRAAAGALFRIPILTGIPGEEAVDLLCQRGKRIIGTGPEGAVAYTEVDLSTGCALVIGNEGNGMSDIFTAHAHENVTIPMMGGLESLNAAVAAGILMYRSTEKGK